MTRPAPARLAAAIQRGDVAGALTIAARHVRIQDRETINRALEALHEAEHVKALGRNPKADVAAGIAVIHRNFGAQP